MEPKPTTFTFESWNFDPESHRLTFSYRVGSKYTFVETLDFPRDIPYAIDPLNHTGFREAAEALHLIGGISYYKAFCPPEIQKEGQPLSLAQAQFWNTVYEKGLGEFFYRNSIDHRDFIRFPSEGTKEFEEVAPRNSTSPEDYRGKKILVPLGGGKDSIVTLELLREHGANCTLFRMNPHPIIRELARQASLPLIEVQRTLSPLLFEVNSKGAYNGHVPITMYVSLLGILTGILYGFEGFAVSSERSASEGNVIDSSGMVVNHQWSKSAEAEELLRQYIHTHIGTDVSLINLLRPMSELAIAKAYAAYPRYFKTATSCNTNWKLLVRNPSDHHWCGSCPKCAFCFAIFAPFIPADTLVEIFGTNLFDRQDLLPLYEELLGITGIKPFECVGTPQETAAALYLAASSETYRNTPVIQLFREKVLPTLASPGNLIDALLTPDHAP